MTDKASVYLVISMVICDRYCIGLPSHIPAHLCLIKYRLDYSYPWSFVTDTILGNLVISLVICDI